MKYLIWRKKTYLIALETQILNDPTYNLEEDAPYLLQLKQVQRRFVTRFLDSGSLQIQFGAGATTKSNDEEYST